jgi:hypothetical protein
MNHKINRSFKIKFKSRSHKIIIMIMMFRTIITDNRIKESAIYHVYLLT